MGDGRDEYDEGRECTLRTVSGGGGEHGTVCDRCSELNLFEAVIEIFPCLVSHDCRRGVKLWGMTFLGWCKDVIWCCDVIPGVCTVVGFIYASNHNTGTS